VDASTVAARPALRHLAGAAVSGQVCATAVAATPAGYTSPTPAVAKGSAMTSAAIKLEILPDRIALVTFDQPGSRANTLGQAIQGELEAVLAELGRQKTLVGLVFRSGKEGMFIAGADIKELGGAKPEPDVSRQLVKRGLDVIAAFENLPYPTVA